MTTISIAHDVPADAVARVQALLDETARRDVNWNGAEFRIVRDDYTCIPDDDSADAVGLLKRIYRAIDGE